MTGDFQPASSIDLDCHIVHVCSSIYLDYHFFFKYMHMHFYSLNLITVRAFMICLSLSVSIHTRQCRVPIGNEGIMKSKYTC